MQRVNEDISKRLVPYARQFIGGMDRPDVDKVDGLSPVVAIEQKTTSKVLDQLLERLLSCMIFSDCSMPELPMPTAVPRKN